MRYAVVISTTTKAREFPFEGESDARSAANQLWVWAKGAGEHGTITIYRRDESGWVMVQHEKV
jgi:hypothetical protein